MTPEEKQKIDAQFAELTKNEVAFLKEMHIPTNEHVAYVFVSSDETTTIALDMFMAHYRQWLIENDIVKEIK